MVKNRIALAIVLVFSAAHVSADWKDNVKAAAKNPAVQATVATLIASEYNAYKAGDAVVGIGTNKGKKPNESELVLTLFGLKFGVDLGSGWLGLLADTKFRLPTDHVVTSGQAGLITGAVVAGHFIANIIANRK